jgi:hypothetical protein
VRTGEFHCPLPRGSAIVGLKMDFFPHHPVPPAGEYSHKDNLRGEEPLVERTKASPDNVWISDNIAHIGVKIKRKRRKNLLLLKKKAPIK